MELDKMRTTYGSAMQENGRQFHSSGLTRECPVGLWTTAGQDKKWSRTHTLRRVYPTETNVRMGLVHFTWSDGSKTKVDVEVGFVHYKHKYVLTTRRCFSFFKCKISKYREFSIQFAINNIFYKMFMEKICILNNTEFQSNIVLP